MSWLSFSFRRFQKALNEAFLKTNKKHLFNEFIQCLFLIEQPIKVVNAEMGWMAWQ